MVGSRRSHRTSQTPPQHGPIVLETPAGALCSRQDEKLSSPVWKSQAHLHVSLSSDACLPVIHPVSSHLALHHCGHDSLETASLSRHATPPEPSIAWERGEQVAEQSRGRRAWRAPGAQRPWGATTLAGPGAARSGDPLQRSAGACQWGAPGCTRARAAPDSHTRPRERFSSTLPASVARVQCYRRSADR